MKKSYLAILIYCSFLISCSTISKQRSAQKNTNTSESQLTETRQHQLDSQASQWLQSWLQQLQFSTTLIHSDSTISYLPNGGFQLSRGSIILTEASQQSSFNQESKSSEKQEGSYLNQQSTSSQKEQQSNKQSEKERLPAIPPFLLAIFGVLALLSPLLLVYLNKKNKR